MLYMCIFVPVHTPFGPAVADLVVAAAVQARDAMPPRALIDQPLPGRDTNDTVVCCGRRKGSAKIEGLSKRRDAHSPLGPRS